jgi:hypothetical protein
MKFDRLTVVGLDRKDDYGNKYWKCVCAECGGEQIVQAGNLTRIPKLKRRSACKKCYQKTVDLVPEKFVHGYLRRGELKDALYVTWKSMMGRCYKKWKQTIRWWGRGIVVCDAWHSFERFKAWALENGYSSDLSIDRIDNDGNYEPDNCEWVSRSENSRRAGLYRWDPERYRREILSRKTRNG